MTKQANAPLTLQEHREAVAKAAAHVATCNAAYKAEWKRDPTAKNYRRVDAKLGALHDAEAQLAAAREAAVQAGWRTAA